MIDLQTLETAVAPMHVTTPDGGTRAVHVEANTNPNGDEWVELRVTEWAKAVFAMKRETAADMERERGPGSVQALFTAERDKAVANLRAHGRPIVADRN